MRYLSAALFAAAAAAHCAALANALGLAVIIALGVLTAMLAIQAIVSDALKTLQDTETRPSSRPTQCWPAITDDELRRTRVRHRPF